METRLRAYGATMKHARTAIVIALPLSLFACLASARSWHPHTLEVFRNPVSAVAFSPDGKMLATCGGDGMVRLWNVQSRQVLHTLAARPAKAHTIAFSPDSRLVAAALNGLANDSRGKVMAWD